MECKQAVVLLFVCMVLRSECRLPSGVAKLIIDEVGDNSQKRASKELMKETREFATNLDNNRGLLSRKLSDGTQDSLGKALNGVFVALLKKVDDKKAVLSRDELDFMMELMNLRREGLELSPLELDILNTVDARWVRQGGIFSMRSGGAYSEHMVEQARRYRNKVDDDAAELLPEDVEYLDKLVKQLQQQRKDGKGYLSSLEEISAEAYEARLKRAHFASKKGAGAANDVVDGADTRIVDALTGRKDLTKPVVGADGKPTGEHYFVGKDAVESVMKNKDGKVMVKQVGEEPKVAAKERVFDEGVYDEGINPYNGEPGNKYDVATGKRVNFMEPVRDAQGKHTGQYVFVGNDAGNVIRVERTSIDSLPEITYRTKDAQQMKRTAKADIVFDEGTNPYSGGYRRRYDPETGKRLGRWVPVRTSEHGKLTGEKIFVDPDIDVISAWKGPADAIPIVKFRSHTARELKGSEIPRIGSYDNDRVIQEGYNTYSGELGHKWIWNDKGYYERGDLQIPIRDGNGKDTGSRYTVLTSRDAERIIKVEEGPIKSLPRVTFSTPLAREVRTPKLHSKEAVAAHVAREKAGIMSHSKRLANEKKDFMEGYGNRAETLLEALESNPSWQSVEIRFKPNPSPYLVSESMSVAEGIKYMREQLGRVQKVSTDRYAASSGEGDRQLADAISYVRQEVNLGILDDVLRNLQETQEIAAKKVAKKLDEFDGSVLKPYSDTMAAANKRIEDAKHAGVDESAGLAKHTETLEALSNTMKQLREAKLDRDIHGKWDIEKNIDNVYGAGMVGKLDDLEEKIRKAKVDLENFSFDVVKRANSVRLAKLKSSVESLTDAKKGLDKAVDDLEGIVRTMNERYEYATKELVNGVGPSVDDIVKQNLAELSQAHQAMATIRPKLLAKRQSMDDAVTRKLKELEEHQTRSTQATDVLLDELDLGDGLKKQLGDVQQEFTTLHGKLRPVQKDHFEMLSVINNLEECLKAAKNPKEHWQGFDNPFKRLSQQVDEVMAIPANERTIAQRMVIATSEKEDVFLQGITAIKLGDQKPLNSGSMIKEIIRTFDTPSERRTPLQKQLVQVYVSHARITRAETDVLVMKIRMVDEGRKLTEAEMGTIRRYLESPDDLKRSFSDEQIVKLHRALKESKKFKASLYASWQKEAKELAESYKQGLTRFKSTMSEKDYHMGLALKLDWLEDGIKVTNLKRAVKEGSSVAHKPSIVDQMKHFYKLFDVDAMSKRVKELAKKQIPMDDMLISKTNQLQKLRDAKRNAIAGEVAPDDWLAANPKGMFTSMSKHVEKEYIPFVNAQIKKASDEYKKIAGEFEVQEKQYLERVWELRSINRVEEQLRGVAKYDTTKVEIALRNLDQAHPERAAGWMGTLDAELRGIRPPLPMKSSV